ncbi:copper homeostasis protein CutC [Spiroplasma taiwanense]|uniref:Copper homeostasis protein cutC homolog n=1 Tax=Spiroplasma taiwanense CT-1 TaxID=1276220 RepID=S5M0H9_9MOLU|nr:copper homeostasis protein CutC [Spiroplasma taiwanense]AGR41502.1 copper homeostasis protein [Spiroplasma taiwanense CT-1]
MLLEIIAKNIEDSIIINKTKANRIEFCKNLEVGGLTPNREDIVEVCNNSVLPVNVIVRSTARDFFYINDEKCEMLKEIEFIRTTKANGIVIGALNKDFTIDQDFLKKVIEIKGNLSITFHKAFDLVQDFEVEYKKIAKLKIDNVLTSGGQNLKHGFAVIEKLVNLKLSTIILVGGGINKENFKKAMFLTKNVHIGTAARVDNTWNTPIDLQKVSKLLNE